MAEYVRVEKKDFERGLRQYELLMEAYMDLIERVRKLEENNLPSKKKMKDKQRHFYLMPRGSINSRGI